MDEAQVRANAEVLPFMTKLAAFVKPVFPHHANALLGEILGTRLTDERWRRVADVLASLYAVPGVTLTPQEHEVRNIALTSVAVASKMAAAGFGSRDPDGCRELVAYYVQELVGRIEAVSSAPDKGKNV